MDNTLVSEIAWTCNGAYCLEKAIDGQFKQIYPNFEIFVIDSESIDETYKLFDARCAGNARVKYFRRLTAAYPLLTARIYGGQLENILLSMITAIFACRLNW